MSAQGLDNLPLYYKMLFPSKLFYRWLSYGSYDKTYFERREFSFTLQNDIYLRYQSFADATELRKGLATILPAKIDIGAVFDKIPRDNKKNLEALRPLERELIFDIDMDDYDDIRTCCKGPEICRNCWRFIVIAAKVLDAALREDFGFENILWVYSGRRGIHGWVSDSRARKLQSDARTAIVDYLSVIEGGEFKSKKVTLPPNKSLHPSIERAIKIIENYFVDFMVKDQKLFDTEESTQKVIDLCQDQDLKKLLRQRVLSAHLKDGVERWKCLDNLVHAHIKEKNNKTFARYYIEEIMLQMCYPRLDVNVTRGLNHLLKAPFCVHPKTNRICVPIDMAHITKFDPFSVPTIDELCAQIDEYDRNEATQPTQQNGDGDKVEAYKKTGLVKSIDIFQKFIKKCELEALVQRRDEEKNSCDY